MKYLVLGGNGFVGYNVLKELVKGDFVIKCVERSLPMADERIQDVEYYIGDIWDRQFLLDALTDVDVVLDFVSTSLPNSNKFMLDKEIETTLKYHDYVLSAMVEQDVKKYVFPSSGGAIYGNKENGVAVESEHLMPSTPYGVGKQMVETMIKYYHQRCGINATILRIGNVYGSQRYRDKAQGVIDVFIQNAIMGDAINVWGNAERAIRDYVHLDDVAYAVKMVLTKGIEGVNTYNIGTGRGTSLAELITMIESFWGKKLDVVYNGKMSSGLNSIVLSAEKIYKEIGWRPKVCLEEGIQRTIEEKNILLGRK